MTKAENVIRYLFQLLLSGNTLSRFVRVRFTDEEVLKNMNGVIRTIESVVEEREKTHPLYPRQRGTDSCPAIEGHM